MKKLFTKHFKKVCLIGIIVFGLLFLSNCKKDLPEQKKLENNLITPDISEQTTKLSKQDELLLDSIYESYEYSKIAEIANKTQAFIAKMQEYSNRDFDKEQSKYRKSKQDFDDNLNYDLDKVSRAVLEGYIEVGKFYTHGYVKKLFKRFSTITTNKKIKKIIITKINLIRNPTEAKKTKRVKVDIIVEGKTRSPFEICDSKGKQYDAFLNTCVDFTYNTGGVGGTGSTGSVPSGDRNGGSGGPSNYPDYDRDFNDGLYGRDGYTVSKPSDYLAESLSITDPSIITYLNRNQTISDALFEFLDINGYSQENKEFIIWGIRSLISGYLSFEEFESEYLTDFDNPIDAPDVSKINNGIEIIDADTPPPPSSQLKLIGSTTDRYNTEDLTYGFDGNTDGLKKTYLFNYSNDQLFDEMKGVLDIGSTFGLRDVTTYFWNTFKTNASPSTIVQDPRLNNAVGFNASFTDFLKKFGDRLRIELTNTNGQINTVNINMGLIRPIFGGNYNMFHGLTILINDTEKTEIRLEKFETIPGSNKFFATVEITIIDHFGVDKNDALGKEHIHGGFTAWWLLQHKRGKVPFITKVVVRKTIIGYY